METVDVRFRRPRYDAVFLVWRFKEGSVDTGNKKRTIGAKLNVTAQTCGNIEKDMIYWLKRGFESKGGGASWSETTEMRKPAKGVDRFHATDYDRFPLGPFPPSLRHKIETHWLLLGHQGKDQPRTFMSIGSGHFSGLQVLDSEVSEVFCEHAPIQYQKLEIPKMWSLNFDRRVFEPHFFINVYRQAETIDLEASGARKVINPKIGNKFYVNANPRKLKLRPDFKGYDGVWRDRNTSDWFCDQMFREAIEKVTPGTYRFECVLDHIP